VAPKNVPNFANYNGAHTNISGIINDVTEIYK